MPLITLISDFGTKDHFVASIKGSIYCQYPEVSVIDISHQVSPFDINETIYILKNSYKSFPKGTVHLICIDTEPLKDRKYIVMYYDGHYFIATDNGILTMLIANQKPDKLVSIDTVESKNNLTVVKDVFTKIACHILKGGVLDVVGKPVEKLKETYLLNSNYNDIDNKLYGSIIYIDHFGNLVSNIEKQFFENCRKGRDFKIYAGSFEFDKIYNSYGELETNSNSRSNDGDKLALFNSSGNLEISIYKSNLDTVGGASTLLGLKYRDNITVHFFTK
ncbi:MAG: SAM-dependent chlorinase/fluorinase [Flavobacteriaceae bacterium]|nr:SAM-dependent chlorinase/fluorinase [Flavobacteriaceae bacterium]